MKKFLTPKELGELLGKDQRLIERYCREGVVPAKKLGGRWVIPASFVEGLYA